ncbi:hypothetical protein ACIO93_36415 [Streptomyces sp. NPDC087903]|uniref:hypothetical protein n=1 Tax=Streptomyces sp. NPDC087903 TaxID=3365819 RepID=UPI00380662FC
MRGVDKVAAIRVIEQRRRSTSSLSQQAAQAARQAGHLLSDAAQWDVESTLRAVLTDPDAADRWAGGRLEGALTPPADFPSVTAPAAGTPRKPSGEAAPKPSARTRTKDELADPRSQRDERLDQARTAAEEAAQQLRDARAGQADAEAARERARERHDQAQQQLQQARQELQRAGQEQ